MRMNKPLPRDEVRPLKSRIWLGTGSLFHRLDSLALSRAALKEILEAIRQKLQDYPSHAGSVVIELPKEEVQKVNV